MAVPENKKTERSKAKSFKSWLEAKPYWEQFLWRLHLEKEEPEDADLKKCYQYLLEDSGVIKTASGRTSIVFPTLDFESTDADGPKLTLDKIENLKEVNALDEGCVIEFGKNLTIIYGDNGAGKSGIGRLLSNACHSRKPRQLLTNARKAVYPEPIPSADFHVTDDSGPSIINYELGDDYPALKAFSVFDHECAVTHLNDGNAVEFVPSKLQVFDEGKRIRWKLLVSIRNSLIESQAFNYLHIVDEWSGEQNALDALEGGGVSLVRTTTDL